MPNGFITFNGTTSTAAGVKAVEAYPPLDRPRRKFTKIEVPGKTGDIIMLEDAWEDYEQEYEIYAGEGTTNSAPAKFVDIMSWLHSANGYARLTDSYNPNYFRMAYYVGPTDVESILNRYGRATIKFKCQGKRYLVTGTITTNFVNGSRTITNPTAYTARPTITVIGSGSGSFVMGSTTVTLNSIDSGMIIDCEKMTVTNSSGTVNLNSYMALGDFPTFPPGNTLVTVNSGGITRLEVAPNWFVI